MTELLFELLNVPPPLAGEIAQVTPLLAGSFWTLAVNCWLPLACTIADEGETETVICVAPITLMAAEVPVIDFVAVSVAVIVWLPPVFSVICRLAVPLASD